MCNKSNFKNDPLYLTINNYDHALHTDIKAIRHLQYFYCLKSEKKSTQNTCLGIERYFIVTKLCIKLKWHLIFN